MTMDENTVAGDIRRIRGLMHASPEGGVVRREDFGKMLCHLEMIEVRCARKDSEIESLRRRLQAAMALARSFEGRIAKLLVVDDENKCLRDALRPLVDARREDCDCGAEWSLKCARIVDDVQKVLRGPGLNSTSRMSRLRAVCATCGYEYYVTTVRNCRRNGHVRTELCVTRLGGKRTFHGNSVNDCVSRALAAYRADGWKMGRVV